MPNKVAVVTGGSRGIGRAIVLALAGAGYQIAFSYVRDEVAAMVLRDEVQGLGIDCLALQCDVSSSDSIKGFFERVDGHFQRVDLLVNNAGITRDGLLATMPARDIVDHHSGGDRFSVTADDNRHFRLGRQVEYPRRRPPALGVGSTHEAITDHGHAQGFHASTTVRSTATRLPT